MLLLRFPHSTNTILDPFGATGGVQLVSCSRPYVDAADEKWAIERGFIVKDISEEDAQTLLAILHRYNQL